MRTRASTVVTCMAVGVFFFVTARGVRLQADADRSVRLLDHRSLGGGGQADLVRLKPDTTNYADGAPPGFSGGFKESSCDACHFEAAVNTPPGRVTLAGVPERYVAGQAYPITITLSRPGMMLGGFQFAARFENSGGQAGTLAPGPGEEKRIKLETGKIQYANQRLDGTGLAEPGIAKWGVVWTAPAAAGSVMFHVAANAADKDDAARGDYVYTAVATSRPQ